MKKNNTDQNSNQNKEQNWLAKVKEVGNKILKVGLQYKKYVAAGCLMVGFVLILVFSTGSKGTPTSTDKENVEVQKNKETKVQKLLKAYYSSYQKADLTTLKSYANIG